MTAQPKKNQRQGKRVTPSANPVLDALKPPSPIDPLAQALIDPIVQALSSMSGSIGHMVETMTNMAEVMRRLGPMNDNIERLVAVVGKLTGEQEETPSEQEAGIEQLKSEVSRLKRENESLQEQLGELEDERDELEDKVARQTVDDVIEMLRADPAIPRRTWLDWEVLLAPESHR